MQQVTELYIHCNTDSEWDNVVKSVKGYLFGISEDLKPEFYDHWLEDLKVDSVNHVIEVLSDVHAPFWDYESILHELIETVAIDNPSAVVTGSIDFGNDEFEAYVHGFNIENSKVVWVLAEEDEDEEYDEYDEY